MLNALAVRLGSNLIVIKVGAFGMFAIMAGKITNAATIVALDLNAQRIDLAREPGAFYGYLANAGNILDHAATRTCRAVSTVSSTRLGYQRSATQRPRRSWCGANSVQSALTHPGWPSRQIRSSSFPNSSRHRGERDGPDSRTCRSVLIAYSQRPGRSVSPARPNSA